MKAAHVLMASALATAAHAQAGITASLECDGVSAKRLADTDGDGRQELLLVQTNAATGKSRLVRVCFDNIKQQLSIRGQIELSDAAHSLICIADILKAPGEEVVVANPKRTACLPWTTSQQVAGEATVLARRARFAIRVDQPQLSPFVTDLNQDGLLDLMLPSLHGVQPFFQVQSEEGGAPTFRRMDSISVPVSALVGTGGSGLDQELTGSIHIPQIDTEDLNGDGRPDLLTKSGSVRAFHLQRADSTFAEPILIDITQFVDSTPKAIMDLGATAVLSDAQLMQSGDINGDGIPDYVIAHRRKIWTFLGTTSGPQFQKARTQAVAEDITAMLVIDLDTDNRADLLTFQLQLPSITSILLGLVRSIYIDVRAVAYPSEQEGFGRKPKWRRTLTVRVPPLLSLLGRQDELVSRVTTLISKAQVSARGEFMQQGQSDLALVQNDTASIQLFPNVQSVPKLGTREGSLLVRQLLFEEENTLFDIERVFGLASGLLDQLSDQSVGEGAATATIKLRDHNTWQLIDLTVGELDGNPCDEIIAAYRSIADPNRRAYDVLKFK